MGKFDQSRYCAHSYHFISMCEASLGYGHMMVKGLTVVSDRAKGNAARPLHLAEVFNVEQIDVNWMFIF